MKKGMKIAVCFGLVIFLSVLPIVSIKATSTVPAEATPLCILNLSLSKNEEARWALITDQTDDMMPAGQCSATVNAYFYPPHAGYKINGLYRLLVVLIPHSSGGNTIYIIDIDAYYERRNETEGTQWINDQPYYGYVPRGTYDVNMKIYATIFTSDWSELQHKWVWDGVWYPVLDKEISPTVRFPMGFPEGSAVKMADGATKNIEEVKVGDHVMSYDELNRITVSAEVVNVYESEMRSVNSIIINNELQIPSCHQLYINNMWTISQSAQENDLILKLQRGLPNNIKISSLSNSTLNDTIFYDLEIDPLDNHINGYWVNNYLVMGRF